MCKVRFLKNAFTPIISILMNVIVYEVEIYFNLTCVKVVAGVKCVCIKNK